MKVGIIGTGYVGLPTGVGLAELGNEVWCIDKDVKKIVFSSTCATYGVPKNIKIFGTDYDTPDGTCIRDYIHVEDLALAHRLAVEKTDEYSGYLNLGTGIGTSVKEIIEAAEEVSTKKCPVEYAPRRAGDPARLFADNTKAKEILGWNPHYIDIKEIIKTAWNWEQNRKY